MGALWQDGSRHLWVPTARSRQSVVVGFVRSTRLTQGRRALAHWAPRNRMPGACEITLVFSCSLFSNPSDGCGSLFGHLSPVVKNLMPLGVKKYFRFDPFVFLPERLQPSLLNALGLTNLSQQQRPVIEKFWFIIPLPCLHCTGVLLIWTVCESPDMGIDFAHWNKAIEFACLIFTHKLLGALPTLYLTNLSYGSVYVSVSRALDFFPDLLIMEFIGCCGNGDAACGWNCPREFWGSSENLRSLEWNGWLARMFEIYAIYQHSA